jgi:hypothetical protein
MYTYQITHIFFSNFLPISIFFPHTNLIRRWNREKRRKKHNKLNWTKTSAASAVCRSIFHISGGRWMLKRCLQWVLHRLWVIENLNYSGLKSKGPISTKIRQGLIYLLIIFPLTNDIRYLIMIQKTNDIFKQKIINFFIIINRPIFIKFR